MGTLDGRVAIITGGGRGVGREHALLFAREGAKVVVNDLGGAPNGDGADISAAQAVVDEITALGGEAVANTDSVTDWAGAERLVRTAVDTFGDLHVVVNNAGILRDRVLVNMSEEEFDLVVAVHLKGTFAVTRHAAAYWREQAKAGVEVDRAIVNTTSGSGLHGNPGQVNYASAKAGIAAMTVISAKELERYHVRANCIAPVARTRLTEATPGLGDIMRSTQGSAFDEWDPANISPLVAMLATGDCRFSGQVFRTMGGQVGLYQGWTVVDEVAADHRWGIDELAEATTHMPATPQTKVTGKHAEAMGKK
ncbi:SDR family oxidoreductase [Streptomyces abyssomicinicus]|uniref:SDR family oxidoreductase n=1 Tax=Streptomyces abyssomicinicus TaxID=574929 RepID=UPI00124FEEF7|nr:SDR family oxidoreductase [Streptomyces abyssomicinicus]